MQRQLAFVLLLVVLAVLAGGCGRGEAPAESGAAASQPAGERTDERDAGETPSGDDAPAPSTAASAADRRLSALVAAYAPVSDRVHYLVAAEALREDAVESGAGEEVEQERFGAVRVERERLLEVLRSTRRRVAAVPVADADQQQVKALLVGSIDARLRALAQLEAALQAEADPETPDSVVEERVSAWQESWDESLRLAREATTAMQETRARLGLEPGPEEAFR